MLMIHWLCLTQTALLPLPTSSLQNDSFRRHYLQHLEVMEFQKKKKMGERVRESWEAKEKIMRIILGMNYAKM